ncbi:Intracellular exo-alpha-(1-_5)-L-arabinofuranosidase [compost metagenome]
MELQLDIRSFGDVSLIEHIVLEHDDLKAVNTKLNPNNIKPHHGGKSHLDNGHVTSQLAKASWNVIRLQAKQG